MHPTPSNPEPIVRLASVGLLATLVLGIAPLAFAQDGAGPVSFAFEPLHDLPMADPGRFWIELGGTVHEGELHACGITTAPTDGFPVEEFQASGIFVTEDGLARRVDLQRTVSGVTQMWQRWHGHSIEQVQVHARPDDDTAAVRIRDDANAVSITNVLIVSPGDEPLLDRGEAEWPFLRVSEDRLRATAIGVLEAVDDVAYADGAVPIVGHVRVAVHCGD